MYNFQDFVSRKEKICIVGLGYVGLPLAIQLSKHFSVIGFEVKAERIKELDSGFDRTKEVGGEELKNTKIEYSVDPEIIKKAKFVIVAVPTPVDETNIPDLNLVTRATETVAKNLTKGSVVVYESTVYPGVTEDVCLPILENISKMKCGIDFSIGYSPERINPGDKEHTISKVTKIVAGYDSETLDLVSQIYGSITKTFKATSIKVAEAAKVIENTQRDLNIALMNELSLIFERLGISVYDVLEAAGTKWNFLKFFPGLVGGHCIGVDPYYLTYKAKELGYNPEVILAGRKVNDGMPAYLVNKIMSLVSANYKEVKKLNFVIFGITFKENVPDSRNSKAAVIYQELKKIGISPYVFDPLAYSDEVKHEYNIDLINLDKLPKADVLILPVAHEQFKGICKNKIGELLNPGALVVDIKHILEVEKIKNAGYNYWTL